MILKACCKINIGLHVVRKREDGYHELETAMLGVRELYDIVEAEAVNGRDITFSLRGITIDCPAEKNLCVRAARLMQERYNTPGVAITLDKRVPFGAGLGGGSSDATAVLVAMNNIFNLDIDKGTLAALAAELGSDTPFFVYDTPQLCTGRGEIMEPITLNLRGYWLAIAKPNNEGVSTAEAYSGIVPKIPERSLRELLKEDIGRAPWQTTSSHIYSLLTPQSQHSSIKCSRQELHTQQCRALGLPYLGYSVGDQNYICLTTYFYISRSYLSPRFLIAYA